MCEHCETNGPDNAPAVIFGQALALPVEPPAAQVETDDMETCCNCSDRFDSDDTVRSNDREVYCRDCYAEQFILCDACSCEVDADSAIMSDRTYNPRTGRRDNRCPFCQECYDERFGRCASCDTECSRDELHCADGDDDDLCELCYSYRYTCCDDCGCEISRESANNTDDGTYCDDCVPDERESVSVPRIRNTGFLTARAFAVELEVYDDRRAESDLQDDDWESESDGSLSSHNEDCGREYCSGPIGGKSAIGKIQRAAYHLEEHNATVNTSCGFHLHIDASSESGATVGKFMRLSKRLEEWAFATQPKSRRDNHYCNRLPQSALHCDSESALERLVYNCKPHWSVKREKYADARYKWMNGHSWFYRGTVEVRLHSGTVNAAKILAWAEFWLKAFDFAKSSTLAEIDLCPTDETAGFWLAERIGIRIQSVVLFAERIKKFSTCRHRVRLSDPDSAAEVNAEE